MLPLVDGDDHLAGLEPVVNRADSAPGTVIPQAVPGGHRSREFQLFEVESGAVTTSGVLTLEWGKTGVPVDESAIKLFETTASSKLKLFASRLETAVLTAEHDVVEFEGFKISFEANAFTVAKEGDDIDVDLMTITLKAVGDAGTWLGLPPHMTATVDARISFALGGKLAAKLASTVAAHATEKALAAEMRVVTTEMAEHWAQVDRLKSQLKLADGPLARKKIEDEIFQRRLKISTANRRLAEIGPELKSARGRAKQALSKITSPIAKRIGNVMAKKTVQQVAKVLAKAIPILNLVSTVIDVIEILGLLKALISGDYGGSGDGESDSETSGDGTSDGESKEETPSKEQDEASTALTAEERRMSDVSDGKLSPAAQAILDAISKRGGSGAPPLDADQRMMLDLIVPPGLTRAELDAAIAALKGSQTRTPEEVMEAVTNAVRVARKQAPLGATSSDVGTTSGGESTNEKEGPKRSIGDGPITSPDQLDAPVTPMEIVQFGDPAFVGAWFQQEGEALVWSSAGLAWKSTHIGTELEPGTDLIDVEMSSPKRDDGWELSLTFKLTTAKGNREVTHHFGVLVGEGTHGIGVRVGGLKFEPWAIIQ